MSSAFSIVCLLSTLTASQNEKVIHSAAAIEVERFDQFAGDAPLLQAHRLRYHQITWGLNFSRPEARADWGDPDKDLSRLPTTYYHANGPFGVALQKFNWFPDPTTNVFPADTRVAASLVGLGSNLPGNIAVLWSETPVAVLGLNVGTEAAYARPTQTVHFVEENADLIALSQPPRGQPTYFGFVTDARKRGACVKIFRGAHRATIAKHGGEAFYHLIVVETVKDSRHEHLHEDLLTKEAMQMLMGKTVEQGVICFHTSHRYVNLPPLIASVAKDCGYAALQGNDNGEWRGEHGAFTSEWVMVARKVDYLKHLHTPDGYNVRSGNEPYWRVPKANHRHVWKDGQTNSYAGLWRRDPYVSEVGDWVRTSQFFLMRHGLNRELAKHLTAPFEEAGNVLHHLVLEVRNR